MATVYRTNRRTQRPQPLKISELSEERLLELRMSDLNLRIAGTVIKDRIDQLYDELDARGIAFRPHFWISDEWFSPDGVPGIALPFYLAHPRLVKLEKKQMQEVEGGSHEWCMKILRHEAGHAIDTAYRLRRKSDYREVFGRVSTEYPTYYKPDPSSRSFVQHLGMWYAQSHPVEDFAETFAVWLKPRSRWRSQYQDWPALRKLNYVNQIMEDVANEKPKVTSREKVEPIREIRKTLGEHYAEKRKYYDVDIPDYHDADLQRLFSAAPEYRGNQTAASFMNSIHADLSRLVARWTGEQQYTIDQILSEMIQRCRVLNLKTNGTGKRQLRDDLVAIAIRTMNDLHTGQHRVAL